MNKMEFCFVVLPRPGSSGSFLLLISGISGTDQVLAISGRSEFILSKSDSGSHVCHSLSCRLALRKGILNST